MKLVQAKSAALIVLLAAVAASAAPAAADAGLSVTVGPTFVLQSAAQNVGATAQTNVNVAYDIGPKVPLLRPFLTFDYAGGSANGGSLSDVGGGIGVRLTTPLYAGASLGFYAVNATPGGNLPSSSTTSVGTNLFAGERLFALPGIGLSLQATYRQIPQTGGYNPSSVTLGLRAQF